MALPGSPTALLVVPVGLPRPTACAWLALVFSELRELVFAKATHGAARAIALKTFEHLHALLAALSPERQTGA